jgi:hypothetical protein
VAFDSGYDENEDNFEVKFSADYAWVADDGDYLFFQPVDDLGDF